MCPVTASYKLSLNHHPRLLRRRRHHHHLIWNNNNNNHYHFVNRLEEFTKANMFAYVKCMFACVCVLVYYCQHIRRSWIYSKKRSRETQIQAYSKTANQPDRQTDRCAWHNRSSHVPILFYNSNALKPGNSENQECILHSTTLQPNFPSASSSPPSPLGLPLLPLPLRLWVL